VHKSQGSEFEHTVLVLPPHAGGLNRELIYTGITRARQAFTLMTAQPGLMAMAIKQPTRRASGLLPMLETKDNVGQLQLFAS
jgi:exodeoxyribonuclease V alpha subunit